MIRCTLHLFSNLFKHFNNLHKVTNCDLCRWITTKVLVDLIARFKNNDRGDHVLSIVILLLFILPSGYRQFSHFPCSTFLAESLRFPLMFGVLKCVVEVPVTHS